MTAVAEAPAAPKGLYEWVVIGLLTLMAVDVISLFIGGALHMEALLNGALGVFVYIQMAMTGASLLSLPVTILARIVRR